MHQWFVNGPIMQRVTVPDMEDISRIGIDLAAELSSQGFSPIETSVSADYLDRYIEVGTQWLDDLKRAVVWKEVIGEGLQLLDAYWDMRANNDPVADDFRTAARCWRFILESGPCVQDAAPTASHPDIFDEMLALSAVLLRAKLARTEIHYGKNAPEFSGVALVEGELIFEMAMTLVTQASFGSHQSAWLPSDLYASKLFESAFLAEFSMTYSEFIQLTNILIDVEEYPARMGTISAAGFAKAALLSGIEMELAEKYLKNFTYKNDFKKGHLIGRKNSLFNAPLIELEPDVWVYSYFCVQQGMRDLLKCVENGTYEPGVYQSQEMQKYTQNLRRERELSFEDAIAPLLPDHYKTLRELSIKEFAKTEPGRIDLFAYSEKDKAILLVEAKYLNSIQFEAHQTAELLDRFFYDKKSYCAKWNRRHQIVEENIVSVLKKAGLNIDSDEGWKVTTLVVTHRSSPLDEIELQHAEYPWGITNFKTLEEKGLTVLSEIVRPSSVMSCGPSI